MNVSMTINGERVSHDVEPRLLLVHYIRETVGLTGTHWGCDTSNCGACVVLIDGEPDVVDVVALAADEPRVLLALEPAEADRALLGGGHQAVTSSPCSAAQRIDAMMFL